MTHNLKLAFVACLDFSRETGSVPTDSDNQVYWAKVLDRKSVNWRGALLPKIEPIGSRVPQSEQALRETIISRGERVFDSDGYRMYANFKVIKEGPENPAEHVLFAFLKCDATEAWYEPEEVDIHHRLATTCRDAPSSPIFFVTNRGTIASVNPSRSIYIGELFSPSSDLEQYARAFEQIDVVTQLEDFNIPRITVKSKPR